MGANDAAEMLEVAKEECVRLERALADTHKDRNYWKAVAHARAVTIEAAKAAKSWEDSHVILDGSTNTTDAVTQQGDVPTTLERELLNRALVAEALVKRADELIPGARYRDMGELAETEQSWADARSTTEAVKGGQAMPYSDCNCPSREATFNEEFEMICGTCGVRINPDPTATEAVKLDPEPYRNWVDGSRWKDNGGDPELVRFLPQEGYSQSESDYAAKLPEKGENR